jgi:hypothetical protein
MTWGSLPHWATRGQVDRAYIIRTMRANTHGNVGRSPRAGAHRMSGPSQSAGEAMTSRCVCVSRTDRPGVGSVAAQRGPNNRPCSQNTPGRGVDHTAHTLSRPRRTRQDGHIHCPPPGTCPHPPPHLLAASQRCLRLCQSRGCTISSCSNMVAVLGFTPPSAAVALPSSLPLLAPSRCGAVARRWRGVPHRRTTSVWCAGGRCSVVRVWVAVCARGARH